MESTNSNKAIVHHFFDSVFNQRKLSVLKTHFSAAAACQVKQSLGCCLPLIACPDIALSFEDAVAESERVVCRVSWRGTHEHECIGVAPTGRTLSGSTTELFQFANGKIVECTQNWTTWGRSQLLESRPARVLDPVQDATEEPILEIGDIQGHLIIGFNTHYQVLMFVEIVDITASKAWLRAAASWITSAEEMLAAAPVKPASLVSIGFSFAGLSKLTPDAKEFFDEPFKHGLHARSRLLGDPIDTAAPGHPSNWIVGGAGNVPDLLLIIAHDDRDVIVRDIARIEAELPSGLRLIHKESGAHLGGHSRRREHFGFRDPVSQPGLRGRISAKYDDFLTPRQNPANLDEGKPGQRLIWPGEFVFGYPGQNAMDLVKPGLVADAGPKWGRNGSLLVFRRLRQDVAALHEFLRTTVEDLSRRFPDMGEITPQWLGAKFVGRWTSGAPLMRAATHDSSELAENDCAANDFCYVDARRTRSRVTATPDETDGAPGDLLGLICPQAAHIRKAYPRDHATPVDTVASIETHRLLRRGVPFGEPFPSPGERGLLFLAYQTSIERQFEFITRAWLNNPRLREEADGHDPLVGQTSSRTGIRAREFVLPLRGLNGMVERVTVHLPVEWITPTGGGYFFVPGLSALRHLAAP